MAFKFAVLAILLAVANAGLIAAPGASSYSSSSISHGPTLTAYAAPVAHVAHVAPLAYAAPIHKTIIAEQHAPAQYDFEYSVHDGHTGDVKSQKESRKGDAVHGVYSLIEPDGSKRVVEYTADDHNGFNAVVHREPSSHPVVVKAAPVLKYTTAPIAHVAHVAPAYATYGAPAHYIHH